MAAEGILKCLPGAIAAADLSASQYQFVKQDSNGQFVVNTTAGGDCTGILQDKPAAAGRACRVAVGGRVKVKAAAAITVGAKVASNNAGKAVTATAGQYIMGEAVEAATANGDIIAILFAKNGVVPA